MDYRTNYEFWREHAPMTERERSELNRIASDEQSLRGAFGAELQFGTAGIRGIMEQGTNRMNEFTVRRTAQGLTAWLCESKLPQKCAIAYDSRHNSRRFAEICAEALAERRVRVYLYHELAPTPMLSFAVRELGCGCGIVVSASHNAGIYNGIKCYGPDGCQMTDEPAARVYESICSIPYFLAPKYSFDELLRQGSVEYIAPELWERYYRAVLAQRVTDRTAEGLHVVYTPLCGTGNKPVREALRRIGAQVEVVSVQEKPDGDFKTCEYPNPETDAALDESYKLARVSHPDLILGTDPDCDRAAVAVEKDGGFIKLTGNELGCLLLDYILGTLCTENRLPEGAIAIRSIVSTPLADRICEKYGVRMVKVLTGFKYIGGEILKLEQAGQENRFLFAFEESCGYLKGSYARDKDAVIASVLTVDLAAKLKREGKNLFDRMQELYREFGWHETKVVSVELQGPDAMQIAADFMTRFRAELPTSLGGVAVTFCTDYRSRMSKNFRTGETQPVMLPQSNVVALELDGKGSVIVRPSGTEPKIKFYLTAVSEEKEDALALLTRLEDDIRAFLK